MIDVLSSNSGSKGILTETAPQASLCFFKTVLKNEKIQERQYVGQQSLYMIRYVMLLCSKMVAWVPVLLNFGNYLQHSINCQRIDLKQFFCEIHLCVTFVMGVTSSLYFVKRISIPILSEKK